jgi:hypothetical protein
VYWRFIRNFAPKQFDFFVFVPSIGASGEIIVLWNSSVFTGLLLETQSFGARVSFTSVHNNSSWVMVCVYGPCQGIARDEFVSWLYKLNIPTMDNWLVLGDLNFIRDQENRNKPGGNIHDMMLFNEIVGHLGLLELPLKGRSFTRSNMQREPLLEQLDWFFTSANWISKYPHSMVLPLAKIGSDHVPCMVTVDTSIPKP